MALGSAYPFFATERRSNSLSLVHIVRHLNLNVAVKRVITLREVVCYDL